MPENIGDLLHGRAGPQQPARDAVPENMDARALSTRIACMPLELLAGPRRCRSACRKARRDERISRGSMFEAARHADRQRSRQPVASGNGRISTRRVLVPPRRIVAVVPVDIFEPKIGDFAASQAEIGEAPQPSR